ncbi:MAG TPA: FAD-dependent oxidoreductase [Verrucomicrobiota bacterium]|nr:FAD-dependent oxidoreductase [Verrucomicrobiota bacterium]
MSARPEVLVIGAGVIGLCTAYYCARRGLSVTVLDRQPAQHDGCSFGNAGMIVPSHFVPLAAPGMVALGLKWMANPESPFYIRPRLNWELLDWGVKFWRAATAVKVQRAAPRLRDLHLASRAAYEELAALPGHDFGLVKRGLLMLCKTPHTFEEETRYAAQANALGIPAQVLDPHQVAALDPDITMNIAGAVYFPRDCHLSPDRFMAGLQSRLEQLGVKFLWNADVTDFRIGAAQRIDALVLNDQREVHADEFVLAGGSWSAVLARKLSLNIPLQAGKGYSLTLPQPRQLPQLCSILTEARVAVTPMNGSLRFGGTMEIAGLNEEVNPVRVRGIIKSIPWYFPKFSPEDFQGIQPWRGLRPCSPDGLPYLGRTAKFSNLCLATGHAMMGLSLGPITGKVVADLLVRDAPGFDLQLLSPDRYG